jgi:hypothetical protein
VAKLCALREKDRNFVAALLTAGLVDSDVIAASGHVARASPTERRARGCLALLLYLASGVGRVVDLQIYTMQSQRPPRQGHRLPVTRPPPDLPPKHQNGVGRNPTNTVHVHKVRVRGGACTICTYPDLTQKYRTATMITPVWPECSDRVTRAVASRSSRSCSMTSRRTLTNPVVAPTPIAGHRRALAAPSAATGMMSDVKRAPQLYEMTR